MQNDENFKLLFNDRNQIFFTVAVPNATSEL